MESLEGYDELLGWPPANLNLKSSDTLNPRSITEDCDEEADEIGRASCRERVCT